MLLNVSYNNKEITRKINKAVGKPFSFFERIKMRGIGSTKLIITDMSSKIEELMELDSNRNQCNIEMRPNGIIVGFRSLLESYALIIPYHKLTIYKGRPMEYSIYRDDHFVKIKAGESDKIIHQFMQKVMDAKADATPSRLEDM